MIFIRSERRPLKQNKWPASGSCFKTSCTCKAKLGKPRPHIGMARRQPYPHARGDRNHRSAFNTADISKSGADLKLPSSSSIPPRSLHRTVPLPDRLRFHRYFHNNAKPGQQHLGEAGDARCKSDRRKTVIPRNLCHTRSRRKGLRNDPAPFILAPTPPPFGPRQHRNLPINRS